MSNRILHLGNSPVTQMGNHVGHSRESWVTIQIEEFGQVVRKIQLYNGEFPVALWRSKKASKRRVVSLRVNELRNINPKYLKEKHPLEELNRLFAASRS